MKAFVYIIYSKSLNIYYTGITKRSPKDRLDSHLHKEFGTRTYSSKADDWELIFSLECESISIARKIEIHIKKMKSRTYISNLLLHKEISEKLLQRYTD